MRVGIIGHLLSFEENYRQAGVSRYTEALVRELPGVSRDLDLVVFTGPDEPPADRAFPSDLTWHHSRLPTAKPAFRIAWEQTAGMAVAWRHRLDVIHAPVNVTPAITGVPRVVTVHDLAFHHFPEQYPGAKQRYLRLMTRFSVRRATRVIAVSEATRRDVIQFYGVDPASVVTVPNGVGPEFQPLPQDDIRRFRDEKRLPDNFVLFLGTLQPRKNLETLLKAYARVHGEIGWDLVVAGAVGWSHEPIFETARALGLADRVRFAGFVAPHELPLWYNAATVLVYPSVHEGFGLPLIEAMACGTPVIAADSSALPEVVGDAGLIVGTKDVGGYAHSLVGMARSTELRQELAERGLKRAAAYSWSRTATETMTVYEQAIHAEGQTARTRKRRT